MNRIYLEPGVMVQQTGLDRSGEAASPPPS